jgi:all-trans-retinol dehydrogenase (NAD+)
MLHWYVLKQNHTGANFKRSFKVTGAGQGLGKEIALILAKRGCKLVLVDLNLDSAQLVAQEITKAGGTAHALRCNIAVAADVALLKQQVDNLVGRVDILVNNAGAIYMEFFMENKLEDIERVVAVNVSGLIYVSNKKMTQHLAFRFACLFSTK